MIRPSTSSAPFAAIFLLSGCALAYEILLVRLFAIMHWHHFAFMVISIALLGYGASGSFISIFRRRLLKHYELAFALNGLLFGLSAMLCFMLVRQLSFNTLEILWDPGQWLNLLLVYLLLCLPFFFVASAIALSFIRFPRQIAGIYGVDLIAAGAGALLIVLLLESLSPSMALRLISACGTAAALLYAPTRTRRVLSAGLMVATLLLIMLPSTWIEPVLTPYKGLMQALQVKDARLVQRQDSARSRIDVVASDSIPFRHAPGLSLQSPTGPPPQLAVFLDGDRMEVMDRHVAQDEQAYHAYLSSALPFLLRPDAADVLLLNAGAGQALQQARWFGVPRIDVVEPERRLSNLYRGDFADYTGWTDNAAGVIHHELSARAFLGRGQRFDLILMGSPGASAGAAAGVGALVESYDLTVESIGAGLASLKPGGMIGITLWTDNPPRASLRLFATAVEALRDAGIAKPENHLGWIRSWNTATLVITDAPLDAKQRRVVREFAASRSFDLSWLPDIDEKEVNRYQILQQPFFYLAARAMLRQDMAGFINAYEFDIRPVRDDRPFFYLFFQWSTLKQALSLPAQAAASFTGLGFPTLLVTLGQALFAALLLILLPLVFLEKSKEAETLSRSGIVLFFLSIGLAYLFIEIAFIQRFTLVLDHPLYAVSAILGSFLVFSGLGSLYVQRQLTRQNRRHRYLMRLAALAIAVLSPAYVFLLPPLSGALLGMENAIRLVVCIVVIAPLAFLMGMPFTLGLTQLERQAPRFIPWAWGINGCASVLSAILAVLLAAHVGFSVVIMIAGALYLVALRASRSFAGG